ncbi:MAG: glycosyltransferase family 4 protein [Solirubrobacteraceae bacterium]
MSAHTDAPVRVTMLLENNPYPRDVRVRAEAESLVSAGYAVEVIAPRAHGQRRREVVNGVAVRRFRCIDGSGRGASGFLLEFIIAAAALHLAAARALVRGSDVLHLHNPPDVLFAAGALFRLARRTVIFDHHDLAPETIEVKFGARWLGRAARLCERLTYAVATHVIVTNESYAAIAHARGRKPTESVTVVRNGPPASWLRRERREVRPGALDPVRLAYVGALSDQDGGDTLAPLLDGLRRRDPPVNATLTVIGDGDARRSLVSSLEHHSVADRVTFTGWVAAERIPELLDDADVCIDPAPPTDVNTRSTMVKLAEYLALGKPVVAYDLIEARRTAGSAALLVAAGDLEALIDALALVARDEAVRARLAAAAADRARSLTWASSERALLAAYRHARGRAG